MTSLTGFIAIAIVLLIPCPKILANEISIFAQNNAAFTSILYSSVRKTSDENFVISPLSIQAAGALAFMGANGQTAKEMIVGLHLSENDTTKVGQIFQTILEESTRDPSVQIANKIFLADGSQIKSSFEKITSEHFFTDTKTINFNNARAATDEINKWVRNVTDNRIKNIVTKSVLDAKTRMILANAIAFSGGWKRPFETSRTRKKPFWISEIEQKKVKTMRLLNRFKFLNSHDLNASILEMDYNNSDISMMIILPHTRTGLENLESALETEDLLKISNKLQLHDVVVRIPRFKIKFSTDLRDEFVKMNMTTMFTDMADFSGMLENENIKVDQAIHKAFIEVNERGTEAAAVTTMSMAPISVRYSRKQFFADHPFIFVLKSKSAILFIGRYIK